MNLPLVIGIVLGAAAVAYVLAPLLRRPRP